MHSPKKGKMIFASIFLLAIIIIAWPLASLAHGQQPSQMGSNGSSNDVNNTNAITPDIPDIPAKNVHVGDIDIAYKTFGNGEPILLIFGFSFTMDSWDPTLIETLFQP